MEPFIYEFSELTPETVFAAHAARPYSLFLDSADRAHRQGRYSYLCIDPCEIFEGRDLENLRSRLALHAHGKKLIADLPPFQGGAAGIFTYDGSYRIGIYDQVMAFDHQKGEAWIIVHAADATVAVRKRDAFLKNYTPAPNSTVPVNWRAQTAQADYKSQVGRVKEYIRAGDIFQANLSQKFEADLPPGFDPYAHYLNLRRINPAPFSGFMNLGDVTIASASPESFLTVRGRGVETRPIKGTRARDSNPNIDAQNRMTLQNNAKDRAENIMIVDLLRNDLSKVCAPDSITVPALCALESFASVHHLVSTVAGRLQDGKDALDLLAACFPGGSITGAPKKRAMQIIAEMEQEPRGPYCGCLGMIGFDGFMQTNILIRTLVYEGNQVWFRSGGGITAQSDPAQEYQETMDKAARIFESFENAPIKRRA